MIGFVRAVLFYVVFFGGTFCLSAAGTVVYLVAPTKIRTFAVLWARLGVWAARAVCDIRLEVTGMENIPEGPALIASRHQSAFDTMVWFLLVPRCTYVLKQELLKIPLMGATGMIAVDRDGGARTIRTLVKAGVAAAKNNRQIVIFPEGTRAAPGALLPLQPGVAALASATGLPVIPVLTDSGLFWGRRAFRKVPGTIHIVIRPALPPKMGREALMLRLRQELETGIEATDRPGG